MTIKDFKDYIEKTKLSDDTEILYKNWWNEDLCYMDLEDLEIREIQTFGQVLVLTNAEEI